ncbi:MAG TPA: DUF559 domain-containing protein [Chloroflexota bacterium]
MVEVARQFRKAPTRAEALLWSALRGRRLDGVKFRRQQPIGSFVVDVCAPERRLVVGVDGPAHASQQVLDRQRQTLQESLGLRFLRLPSRETEENLAGALEKIRVVLREECPPIPTPSPCGGRGGTTPSPHVGEEAGGEGRDATAPAGV